MGRATAGLGLFVLLSIAAAYTPRSDLQVGAEVSRLQEHFGLVVAELQARPTESLSASQRQARLETIEWLEEYQLEGTFPHNHVLEDRETPVFVDPHGTPCAVGYLLLRSGESQLVERIVRTNNLIRVPELRDDPRLGAWLVERGLTLEEAARIQPAYQPTPPDDGSRYAGVTVGMSILTAAASSFAVFTDPDPGGTPWLESLSVASAVGHLAMVLVGNDADRRDPTWSKNVNAVGAVAATLVAAERLIRRSEAGSSGEGVTAVPLVRHRGDRLDLGIALVH